MQLYLFWPISPQWSLSFVKAFVEQDSPAFGFQHFCDADNVHPVQKWLGEQRQELETLFIASLLTLQAPTARLVEEEGVLIG